MQDEIICSACITRFIKKADVRAQLTEEYYPKSTFYVTMLEVLSMRGFVPCGFRAEEVELILERFFTGFDVEIERINYGKGYRNGFNVYFNTLPKIRHMDCGQDPSEVEPQRRLISIQIEPQFSACSDSDGMTEGVAVALTTQMARYWNNLDRRHAVIRAAAQRELERLDEKTASAGRADAVE